MLKKRIADRGFHDVIKIDTDDTILSGNQRKMALEELRMEEVWCLIPHKKLTEKEREEVALESNLLDGMWNYDSLANFDEERLKDVGFKDEELDRIFGLGVEEDVFNTSLEYEKIKKSITKKDDLWQLGEHRVLCADSTQKKAVERLLSEKNKADMVFTDPPYNVAYKGTKFAKIEGDEQTEEEFVKFSEEFIARLAEATKPGGAFYICSGYSSFPTFLWALRKNRFEFSTPIIWVKNNTSLGWGDYRHKHEMIIKSKNPPKKRRKAQPILYGWKEGRHYFPETRFEADVWEIKRRASNIMVHPTQKPLELVSRAIRNSSKRGEIVLDLFGGSGSTLIAAEREGRRAYLCELDPKYCDVIIKRWESFTGKKAIKL